MVHYVWDWQCDRMSGGYWRPTCILHDIIILEVGHWCWDEELPRPILRLRSAKVPTIPCRNVWLLKWLNKRTVLKARFILYCECECPTNLRWQLSVSYPEFKGCNLFLWRHYLLCIHRRYEPGFSHLVRLHQKAMYGSGRIPSFDVSGRILHRLFVHIFWHIFTNFLSFYINSLWSLYNIE